ncbi:MAG: hypothetical protein WCK93_00875 [Nitrosomonadales bacterium]|jgi:hypothetical protein
MSIVTMSMSSYEIERNELDIFPAEAVSCPQLGTHTCDTVTLPRGLVTMDAEAFLTKMVAYQHKPN